MHTVAISINMVLNIGALGGQWGVGLLSRPPSPTWTWTAAGPSLAHARNKIIIYLFIYLFIHSMHMQVLNISLPRKHRTKAPK